MHSYSGLKVSLAMGVAFFAAAASAIFLTRLNGGVALMWVASALLLSQIYATPVAQWRLPVAVAFVASMLATLTVGPLGPAAPFYALANVGEALVAAVLIRHWRIEGELFKTTRSVLLFVLGAGVIAPALSGGIGAGLAAFRLQIDFVATWQDWVIGHGLGMLIAMPIIVFLTSGEVKAWFVGADLGRRAEAAGLLALVTLASIATFAQSSMPLLFLPTLPILIATFRMGRMGAGFSMIIVAVVGGYFTLRGSGPITLVTGNYASQLQFFQFYLGVTFLIALPIAGELKQRNALMLALQESEARYRFIADNATDVILNLAIDGTIRYASPSVRNLGLYDPQELIGRNAVELIDAADSAKVQAVHLRALTESDETFTVEYQSRTGDGQTRWFETNMRAVTDQDGEVIGVLSAIRDVGARKSLELKLRNAADTDALTGLPNRRAFDAHLEATIAENETNGTGACIAILDLDFFKLVNDSCGHAAGDIALKTVAGLCTKHLRATDRVARIGGEEFAIVFEQTNAFAARSICERLRKDIEECPIRISADERIQVTISIGIAVILEGESAEQVTKAADAALYQAKASGRNCLRMAA